MIPRTPRSTLFPYSMLFRSDGSAWAVGDGVILHYIKGDHNNGQWLDETPAAIKTARTTLYSVAVQADGSAWAGGGTLVLSYIKGNPNNGHCLDETPAAIKTG